MYKQVDPRKIPSAVRDVIRTLRNAGYQTFLVGGCVRDLYLDIVPHDWDVATDAHPDDIIDLFDKTHTIGARFGTVGVLMPDQLVEVTTFRKDLGYQDHRHPAQVVFTSSIEEDLARRDFTINALAWDPLDERVVDPY